MSEQHVEILHQMYSARRSLASLYPDKFKERCREWQEVIRKVADGRGISELKAVIILLAEANFAAITQMWVLAAYVEMVEPLEE